ncbi:MAG: sialidase family protein [Candidatus Latescibacterota bacterium]
MFLTRLNAALTGNQESWTFIGHPGWRQDHDGLIYPPVWSYGSFDPDPARVPNLYAHELAREDYAFLTAAALGDTDVSVDYKCPYGAVLHGGIVFRAADSACCYVLDVNDLGRKAQAYELALWVQDAAGVRRLLASAVRPHSVVPERIVQQGVRTRSEWDHSSPDWVRLRVQASGSYIRVSMDGQIACELRDDTYPVGCAGLVARGSVCFRNLQVEGTPEEPKQPWHAHAGELPRFFYPGTAQPEGFNAYPVVCRSEDGLTLVAWSHRPRTGGGVASVVLTCSADEGQSWSRPAAILSRAGSHCAPTSLFAHRDGTLSCLVAFAPDSQAGAVTLVLRSRDQGRSWVEGGELALAGRPLSSLQHTHLYSPMLRQSDGSVVMCGYEADSSRGDDNSRRRDRSRLFRSADDGITWQEPVYLDPANFDHNECMVAEVAPGRLVAFMRTLRAVNMWTSRSADGGHIWSRLAQSEISAECPCLLAHRSGTLILGSRGAGTFLRLSPDGGQTWGGLFRLSPASAMMGMAEMADGRVLVVMHEGYRVPGNVRGQYFRVTPDGPVACP